MSKPGLHANLAPMKAPAGGAQRERAAGGSAAMARDLRMHEADRRRAILDEDGIFRLRIETIVGDRDDDADACKRLTEEAVEGFAAVLPTAAMEKQKHRGGRRKAFGNVEIEPRARPAAIGDVAKERITRLRNRQIEQRRGNRQHAAAGGGQRMRQETEGCGGHPGRSPYTIRGAFWMRSKVGSRHLSIFK